MAAGIAEAFEDFLRDVAHRLAFAFLRRSRQVDHVQGRDEQHVGDSGEGKGWSYPPKKNDEAGHGGAADACDVEGQGVDPDGRGQGLVGHQGVDDRQADRVVEGHRAAVQHHQYEQQADGDMVGEHQNRQGQ